MRISKKVAEIWLKLFKKIEIYATILDNNVKYNYRKAVTQYMNRFELVVPCHFGLEAVVKREIYDLGYEITKVEDGRVTFAGDAEAVPPPSVVTVTVYSVGVGGASFSKMALISTSV